MRTRLFVLTVVLLALTGPPAASGQIAVRTPLVDDHTVAPGTTHRGVIVVTNLTDRPQEAKIDAQDYRFTAAGTNRFDAPGSHARSNAAWIRVRPRRVTLPPQGAAEVTYEVTVPDATTLAAGAGAAGTYWSVLMVAPIPPGSAESTLADAGDRHAFGVRQVTRFGVQVATHLSTPVPPQVAVADAHLALAEEGPSLSVALENVGARLTQPTVHLEVYDTQGRVALRTEAPPSRLYPTTSVRHQLALEGLPAGRYEALLVVDAEGERVVGAQYTLDL
jgi:hypothetical protein